MVEALHLMMPQSPSLIGRRLFDDTLGLAIWRHTVDGRNPAPVGNR